MDHGFHFEVTLIREKLASRKCRTLRKPEHTARWLAVWTGVAPDTAIPSLDARIGKIANAKKRTLFAMIFVTHLLGSRIRGGITVRETSKTPGRLKSLYLLMHEHIRVEEDINRVETDA